MACFVVGREEDQAFEFVLDDDAVGGVDDLDEIGCAGLEVGDVYVAAEMVGGPLSLV